MNTTKEISDLCPIYFDKEHWFNEMRDKLKRLLLLLKRFKTTRRHSGAGENNSVMRLISQGMPYYLNRQGYAKNPLTIFFVINGQCNLCCRMCDIGQRNKDSMFYKNLKGESSQDFPLKRFKSLMDEVQSFKPYIGVTTTEPLLYPCMFDAVEYARSRGMYMNISTNGVLLEKKVDEILDSGLHRISVSLDGPSRIHDQMRGFPGTYDKVIRGLELLKEKKRQRRSEFPHIYISTFICDVNYSYLVEFLEKLPKDGVERINIKHMVFFTKSMVERHKKLLGDACPATVACIPADFSPNNLDIDVLYQQTKEIQQRFGHKCMLHFEVDKNKFIKYYFHPEEFMDDTRCVLPWFVAQITASGDLITFTRCYNVIFGNVMNKPFLEVWNGPAFRRFRRDLQKYGRFPACARCDGVLYR